MEERRYSRSISQWKSLTKCGTAFEIGRLKKKEIQPRPAAWSIAGSAFHDALMTWEKGGREDSLSALFDQAYDRMVEEEKVRQPDLKLWLKPPRTKTTENDIVNYKKRFLEKDVPNYERRCREAEWEILTLPDGRLAIELEFELKFYGIPVRGAMDRIQKWPNMNAMEDTKTGSPENHEHDPRQLGLYRIAAQECFGVDLDYGRYWFTKVDRGSEWIDLSRFSWEWYAEQFMILDETIQEKRFLANPGKGCELCDVRPWCPVKGWLQLGEKM